MRRILGYENGRPQWSDNEPAHGRIVGVRGSNLGGNYVTTIVKQAQKRRHAAPDERKVKP